MLGNQILQPRVKQETVTIGIADAVSHDLEALCPIALIREHTKTDDLPHVTDEQLMLYRKAAFEGAEHYAGILVIGTRQVQEKIKLPANYSHNLNRQIKHRFKYRPSQDIAHIYGPGLAETVRIDVGKRTARFPNLFQSSDWNQCCNPCSSGSDYNVLYTAGYANIQAIPAGIITGALKWIAWMIENPGDSLKTIDNMRSSTSRDGLTGTNNVAWASGALEMWRQYNDEAY